MIETTVKCDRCNRVWTEEIDDPWVCLEVHAGESGGLNPGRIDLCQACEGDMMKFMAGEVFHKFLDKRA